MGRLSTAAKSVPRALECLGVDGELVFVDYGDPESAWSWVAGLADDRVTVVRVGGVRWWQMNHARNLAGVAACGKVLVFCDVDCLVSAALVEECAALKEGNCGVMVRDAGAPGFLAVQRADFLRVGGYEEAIVGYGGNDWQFLRAVMSSGVGKVELRERVVHVAGAVQSRELEVRGLGSSNVVNVKICRALKSLHAWRNNLGRNWGWGGEVVKRSRWWREADAEEVSRV